MKAWNCLNSRSKPVESRHCERARLSAEGFGVGGAFGLTLGSGKGGGLERRTVDCFLGRGDAFSSTGREFSQVNGASQLVLDVFGEEGRHARSAVGVAELPLGCSTEVEMILKRRQRS